MGLKGVVGLAFIFATTAVSAGGATGSAATFPSITLTPSQGGVGTTVRVDGSNFCASGCQTTVSIFFSRIPVATATAQNGAFQATFQVPGGQSYGPHDVEADQATPNGLLSAHRTFLVTISQSAPPTLPASPRPPTPSPQPTPSTSPSSDQTPAEPSAPASAPAPTGAGAVAQELPVVLVVAILLLAAGAAAAFYLWRRRHPPG